MDERILAVFDRYLPEDRDPETCWVYEGTIHHTGYGLVTINRGDRIESHRAHRVAYERWVGPIPEGALVLHSCDNPPCVNPAHLRTGSHSDNVRDAIERGRWPQKDTHRKLTDDEVEEIRRRILAGEVQDRLAEEFGVAQSVISDIKQRKIHRRRGPEGIPWLVQDGPDHFTISDRD